MLKACNRSSLFWIRLSYGVLCFIQFGFSVAVLVSICLFLAHSEQALKCCSLQDAPYCSVGSNRDSNGNVSALFSTNTTASRERNQSTNVQFPSSIKQDANFYVETSLLLFVTLISVVCALFGFACLRTSRNGKLRYRVKKFLLVAVTVLLWLLHASLSTSLLRSFLDKNENGFRFGDMCELLQAQFIGLTGNAILFAFTISFIAIYSLRSGRNWKAYNRRAMHAEALAANSLNPYAVPHQKASTVSSAIDGSDHSFTYRKESDTYRLNIAKPSSRQTADVLNAYSGVSIDEDSAPISGAWFPPPPQETMAGENVVIRTGNGGYARTGTLDQKKSTFGTGDWNKQKPDSDASFTE